MNLNLFNVLYLAFRLAPFVLVTYFMVSYIAYGELQSILYLIGLIIACLITMLIGSYFPHFEMKNEVDSMCHLTTMSHLGPISSLPLSTVIYTYTLSYIGIPIYHYQRNQSNLALLIAFPVITFLDILWLLLFGCSKMMTVFVAGLIGASIGLAWSELVYSSSYKQIQYNTILSETEDCGFSSSGFKCVQRSTVPVDKPNTISFQNKMISDSYKYLMDLYKEDTAYLNKKAEDMKSDASYAIRHFGLPSASPS